MSKKIYTVFDKVARKGNNLFLANNQDEAKRIFEYSMKNQQRQNPDFNPSDFTCYYLGIYEDEDKIVIGENGQERCLGLPPFIMATQDSVIDLYDVKIDEEVE